MSKLPEKPKTPFAKRMGSLPKKKAHDKPLWHGPEDSSDLGGITQSMLNSFMVCRERFRISKILGLRLPNEFKPPMEYGNMWHICEEHLAAGTSWEEPLHNYAKELCVNYPLQQEQVAKYYNGCKVQFPIYVDYWKKHADVVNRTPILQEEVFKVPYVLPSGRVCWLRGKWDAVDFIKEGKQGGVYIQENKTKSDIDEQKLRLQLQFDLQSMYYLVAYRSLQELMAGNGHTLIPTHDLEDIRPEPENMGNRVHADDQLLGIRYNVIKRPFSGGKGSIVQKKGSKNIAPETAEEYYERLGEYYRNEPELFFVRFKAVISPQEVQDFENRFLNNILEQLCQWYDWISSHEGLLKPFANPIHYQHPYGIYNVLNEGGSTEFDEYIRNGNDVGLQRIDTLFTELV